MTDNRDLGAQFAEWLNGPPPDAEPAAPPVPRAPRPDYSQGSSSTPTYLDRDGMSRLLFERAIHASLNRPLWEELR